MSNKSDWKQSWKHAIPYLVLLFGILSFTYSIFGTFGNLAWKEFWGGLGKTFIAGGIFALLLKTIQFWGIFKEELLKIIYETKYLENRNDLPEIWERVSKVMFKNKFPTISKVITNDVRNIYFPGEHVLYYDNYKQTLEIELIDPEKSIIKVTQHSEYQVHPNDRSKFTHKTVNTIRFNESYEEVYIKAASYKVNGKEVNPAIARDVKDNCLITSYSVELSGDDLYKFETTIEKQYSLLYDNIIGTLKDNLIHNFDLKILLKGNLVIDFFNIGTLKKFKKTNVKNEHYQEYEYDGIIYPKQGYMLFIKKKNA
jgi:hypothetical protein